MSPFAKLMLRFGWIRLSSYGLEVTLDGRLVSARLLPEAQLDLEWSNVPSPAVDFATTFDPALAAIPARRPPPLPAPRAILAVAATVPASTPTVAPASDDSISEEEEEWAWQAAVAKAKAESESESASQLAQSPSETDDEATGFADTEKLPSSAVKQRPQPPSVEPECDTQVAAEVADSDGEDWEVLVAAARSRENSPAPRSNQHSSYDDTKIDAAPQVPDFAAAQVTQGDMPANDDLPADAVTSINAIKLRSLPVKSQESASPEDDEWAAMRSQIEAKEREENARKMRAMREIQRLQGRASLGPFKANRAGAPPHRKRMAAGTLPAPASRPAISASPLPTRRLSPAAAPMEPSGHDTKVDLPRITERLSR